MFSSQAQNFSSQECQEHSKLPLKNFIADNIGFVELLEVFGSDLTVVNAARVSFNKESFFEQTKTKETSLPNDIQHHNYKLSDKDKSLITYLANHRHITPFFHPQLRFRIKMPIFLVREWYRHTVGFARNEVSRRYVTDEPTFFIPQQLRKKDVNIKQGSSNEIVPNNDTLIEKMKNHAAFSLELYLNLLENDVCPEQARTILPQSMYTEFIETASLAGYARLAMLRLDQSAQKEIRTYAQLVSNAIEQFFPVSWHALLSAGKL